MRKNFIIAIILAVCLLSSLFLSCRGPQRIRTLKAVHLAEDLRKEHDKERLLESVKNANREVRSEALWVLAEKYVLKAMPLFVERAREDSDFNARAMAVYGIKRLYEKYKETDGFTNVSVDAGDTNANALKTLNALSYFTNGLPEKALLNALSDVNKSVQIAATEAFRVIKYDAAVVKMLENLKSKNRHLKMETIKTLAQYSDPRISEAFELLFENEDDLAIIELIKALKGSASSSEESSSETEGADSSENELSENAEDE